jgi:hypothetical protein
MGGRKRMVKGSQRADVVSALRADRSEPQARLYKAWAHLCHSPA